MQTRGSLERGAEIEGVGVFVDVLKVVKRRLDIVDGFGASVGGIGFAEISCGERGLVQVEEAGLSEGSEAVLDETSLNFALEGTVEPVLGYVDV